MDLRAAFIDALDAHSVDRQPAARMWQKVMDNYNAPHRAYHTPDHLSHMFNELLPHRGRFSSWEAVVLAVAYHDVVYDPARQNNEEASAAFAAHVLESVFVPQPEIESVRVLILATKHHITDENTEVNLFTDADLAILGADSATYNGYFRAIRAEYAMYPDAVYIPGRVRVLQGFLEKERVFSTPAFMQKYEAQARRNIEAELRSYGK